MTTLWPETRTPFINLNNKDYKEKNYTKDDIKRIFSNAFMQLLDIFNSFNEKYKKEAQQEVQENDIEQEKEYFGWLLEDSKFLVSFLKNPLNKNNYQKLIDLYYNINCYQSYDLNGFSQNSDKLVFIYFCKNNEFFKNFKSFNLFKYGKFLTVFLSNICCYMRLYLLNLEKQYYYRFEYLVRDAYGYFYFRLMKNPCLLKTDCNLIDLCDSYCPPLEEILN